MCLSILFDFVGVDLLDPFPVRIVDVAVFVKHSQQFVEVVVVEHFRLGQPYAFSDGEPALKPKFRAPRLFSRRTLPKKSVKSFTS